MPKKKSTTKKTVKRTQTTLPDSITTVTSFSKIFALFLFMLVPVIAFVIGTKYGMIHSYVKRQEHKERYGVDYPYKESKYKDYKYGDKEMVGEERALLE